MIVKPTQRAAALAFVLAIVLAVGGCTSGKSWKARFAPERNSVARLALTTDVQVSAKLPIIGGPAGTIALRVESTRSVVSRERRGPTRVALSLDRIAFDVDLAGRKLHHDTAEPPGDDPDSQLVHRYVSRLHGRILTLTIQPNGEITDVSGLDDLYDELEQAASDDDSLAPLLDSLTRDIGGATLEAVFQQVTPVLPGGRLRVGDRWEHASDIPNPLFASMRAESAYELVRLGDHDGVRAVTTTVQHTFTPEGQGPLIASLASMAGFDGDVRVEDAEVEGTSTIVSNRRGETLSLTLDQRIRGKLSVPVKLLGFSRRTRIPLKIDQRTELRLLD